MTNHVSGDQTTSGGDVWVVHTPADMAMQSTAARAALVNRTRRVVRERATGMRSNRSRMRALSIPLFICGSLVVILCTGIWSLLSQYEASTTGMPDASNQLVVMLLWFLPALMAILALAFFRRAPEDVS